jgi:hypothetical protein
MEGKYDGQVCMSPEMIDSRLSNLGSTLINVMSLFFDSSRSNSIMSKSSYSQLHPTDNAGDTSKSPLDTLTNFISQAASITKKGATLAGQTVIASADAVGVKDTFEAAGKATRKLAEKGRYDATKAVNKAKRLASKALDFEEEEDSTDTIDFDLLLSAVGAIKKAIPIHGQHSQVFSVPIGSKMIWKARVKRQDIGFTVKEIGPNGTTEIEPLQKFKSDMQIQGEINAATYNRNITLTFDNSHSLHGKTVAYWIAIGESVSLSDDVVGAVRAREVAAAEEGPAE